MFRSKIGNNFALASVLALSGMLYATPSEARLCSEVKTDLDGQWKAYNMYAGELQNEQNADRRAELQRGMNNFQYNINLLKNEQCNETDPAPPGCPVASSGGGCPTSSGGGTPFDDKPITPGSVPSVSTTPH